MFVCTILVYSDNLPATPMARAPGESPSKPVTAVAPTSATPPPMIPKARTKEINFDYNDPGKDFNLLIFITNFALYAI